MILYQYRQIDGAMLHRPSFIKIGSWHIRIPTWVRERLGWKPWLEVWSDG